LLIVFLHVNPGITPQTMQSKAWISDCLWCHYFSGEHTSKIKSSNISCLISLFLWMTWRQHQEIKKY